MNQLVEPAGATADGARLSRAGRSDSGAPGAAALSGSARVLFPEHEQVPLRSILIRIAIASSCVGVIATIVYLGRSGYSDTDGHLDSWLDAFYYATVTLSTTGYGDIAPLSDTARLLNVTVVTPLRLVFLAVLVGTTIEVLTDRTRQQLRHQRWRKRVKKHTVIIGFGTKGRSSAQALLDQDYPADNIVVVDQNGTNIKTATAMGCLGILGDGRREEVLLQASVPTARQIVIASDRDDTNVLVTLTARRLAPRATIAAAAREQQNITTLRQSGADVVIPTAESAGRLLGLSIAAPNAGELIEELLEPKAGLQVTERLIRPDDIGLSPSRLTAQGEIVLTIVRNGISHRFDSDTIKVFQPGDSIVVITSAVNPPRT